MVNWRENQKVAILGLPYNNRGDYIAKQKEAALMASKKRPPIAWDTEKQGILKMPIRVFLNQQEQKNVVGYDAEAGWVDIEVLSVPRQEYCRSRIFGSILIVRSA